MTTATDCASCTGGPDAVIFCGSGYGICLRIGGGGGCGGDGDGGVGDGAGGVNGGPCPQATELLINQDV
jgi:hypothetical protein